MLVVLGDFNLHTEADFSGVAQDFMAFMASMGLSQIIAGPAHYAGHALALIFYPGHEECDLIVEELVTVPCHGQFDA